VTTTTTVHPNTTKPAPPAPKVFNATITLTEIQLDAFRTNISADVFQTESECKANKEANNLIPIIVGCVLAGMVVVVLVAYLIGRRYNVNNYENLEEE